MVEPSKTVDRSSSQVDRNNELSRPNNKFDTTWRQLWRDWSRKTGAFMSLYYYYFLPRQRSPLGSRRGLLVWQLQVGGVAYSSSRGLSTRYRPQTASDVREQRILARNWSHNVEQSTGDGHDTWYSFKDFDARWRSRCRCNRRAWLIRSRIFNP